VYRIFAGGRVSLVLLLLLFVVLVGGDVRPKRGARVMLIDALSALQTHTTHTLVHMTALRGYAQSYSTTNEGSGGDLSLHDISRILVALASW